LGTCSTLERVEASSLLWYCSSASIPPIGYPLNTLDTMVYDIEELVNWTQQRISAGGPNTQIEDELRELLASQGCNSHTMDQAIQEVQEAIASRGNAPLASSNIWKEKQPIGQATDKDMVIMKMMAMMMDRLEKMEKTQPALAVPSPTVTIPDVTPGKSSKDSMPHPEPYKGDRASYLAFRFKVQSKTRNDFSSKPDAYKIDYLMGRLEGDAAKVALPWVQKNGLTSTVEDMWAFLDRQFKDPYLKTKALDKLRRLKQDKKSVRDYRSQFNQLLLESEETFGNEALKSMFLDGLKYDLQRSLVMVPDGLDIEEFMDQAVKISDRLYRANMKYEDSTGSHRSSARTATAQPDVMDWEPTRVATATMAQKETTGIQKSAKRARWVSKEEITKRKEEKRCLRCGASKHFVVACPYRPAVKPKANQVNVSAVKTASPAVVAEVEDDSDIDLSENE